jgi:hypothetical protein
MLTRLKNYNSRIGGCFMELKEFVDEVIARKNKLITGEVFTLIQNDRVLMKHYLYLVEKEGVAAVNSSIGRMVMTRYGLEPDGDRNTEPESTLITSFREFV